MSIVTCGDYVITTSRAYNSDMSEEFLVKYLAALKRATDLTETMQKKGGVLVEGVDDQLIHDFNQANAEVEAYNKHIASMNL